MYTEYIEAKQRSLPLKENVFTNILEEYIYIENGTLSQSETDSRGQAITLQNLKLCNEGCYDHI